MKNLWTYYIVENMLQSSHEIKEEEFDYYDDDTNNEQNNDEMKLARIQIHEDHKDHKCKSCGESFSQADDLKKHTFKWFMNATKIINVYHVANYFLKHISPIHGPPLLSIPKYLQVEAFQR